jgi:nucleoid-associated protein YejK
MTKEYKKLGSNIDLKGLTIHQVKKDAGTTSATVKLATKCLKVKDRERKFIAKINKSYFENSKPIYGIFANEDITFKTSLSKYLYDLKFLEFTVQSTEYYKIKIAGSPPATGGFLIYAHYENTDVKNDYLLVMTITNKEGFVVSETDLTLDDIKSLDLSKIDVACVINLTKWHNIDSGIDTESKTYLSFAKGNKDISVYFMSFIDCNNKTTKTESTNRLLKAIEDYLNYKKYEREDKIKKRNEVYKYCCDCIEQGKEVTLTNVSTIFNTEQPDEFEKFASVENYSVSSIINLEKNRLKTMKFITYDDKDMKIEFDQNLLKNGTVIFDAKKKQLTFKNIPERLAKQIPS